MARWKFSENPEREPVSTSEDTNHNQSGNSISSSQDDAEEVSTSENSPPRLAVVNGFGSHPDSDEYWENSLDVRSSHNGSGDTKSKRKVQLPLTSALGNSYEICNGDSTVTTNPENHSKVDSTSNKSAFRLRTSSVSHTSPDFFKDTTNALSSVAIPLPAPTSNSTVGGNSTYESRNAIRSPSSINYWRDLNTGTRVLDAGDIGLHNIGNTCFMNSALQCLIHSTNLVEYFLKTNDLETSGPPSLSLVQAFQSVMKSAWNGNLPSIYLTDFRNVLGNIHSQFKDGRQHDCQEFLALTLDTMHEQLKKWKAKPRLIANRVVESSDQEMKPEGCGNSNECGKSDLKVSSASKRVVKNVGYDSKFSVRKNHPFDFDEDDENLDCKIIEPSTKPRVPFSFTSIRKTQDPRKNLWMKLKEPFVANTHWPTKRPIVKKYRKASELSPLQLQGTTKRTRLGISDQKEIEETPLCGCSGRPYSPPPEDRSRIPLKLTPATTMKRESISPEVEVLPKRRRESESLEELSEKVDRFWNSHMAANNTVITSTFQGVYKSTVICSVCQFVSVTYEPFMYLSLPIPRTVTRQLNVTFFSVRNKYTFKADVIVKLIDTMTELKEEVAKMAPAGYSVDITRLNDYVLAEVVNYHIIKTMDNAIPIKDLDDNKSIYMFELNENFDEKYPSTDTLSTFDCNNPTIYSPASSINQIVPSEFSAETYLTENWDPDSKPPMLNMNGEIDAPVHTCAQEVPSCSTIDANNEVSSSFAPTENCDTTVGADWLMCCICQEDCPRSELKEHHCGSILCKDCTKRAAQYFEASAENQGACKKIEGGTYLNCPICRLNVEHELEYTQCRTSGSCNPNILMTSVVFRSDPVSDRNNNSLYSTRLFGTPLVVKIPSALPAQEFYNFLNRINPFSSLEYKAVNVGRDGTQCNQCLYTRQCKGCEFPLEGDVYLTRNSSIAICFTNISEEQIATIEPTEMPTLIPRNSFPSFSNCNSNTSNENEPTIDIHYCLRTFSESEILDSQNPWFCPTCKINQCATKTMTICRLPDYLIVYLKRFIFVEHSSNKLTNKLKFPLNDLDLDSYVAQECVYDSSVYDLYSCICHFGTASAGHYTAYGKNPVTNRWHYFNDSSVIEQSPSESEYTSAYVLFYQRKGLQQDIPKPKRSSAPVSSTVLSNRPIGYITPMLPGKYFNDSSGSSRFIGANAAEGQHQRVRIVDGNTMDELSLSAGNSRFKDTNTNRSQLSSTKHDYTLARSTRVTEDLPEEVLPDEELPDIVQDAEDECGTWNAIQNWKSIVSSSSSSSNQTNGFSTNSKLSRNRPLRVRLNGSTDEPKSTEN